MAKKGAAFAVGLVAVGALAWTVRAQVTAQRPGVMTQSQVWIQNRGPAEAVPVALAAPDVVPVRLVQPAALTLAPGTAVSVRHANQRWEYETVRAASGENAADGLRAAGLQGWEAVGVASSDQTGTTFLMKRPAD